MLLGERILYMNTSFMKEKPIFPLLTSMALPMVFSMLVNALYNIVDSFFVAQISEEAMTALSLVFPMQNLINAIAIGFGVGINAQIALHLGAGAQCRADTAATHGMLYSLLHGIVITIISIAVVQKFLSAFTDNTLVIHMGTTYATIAFSFSIIIMGSLAFEKMYQAIGQMKITMCALVAGTVCNILLDPMMIFGIGPFPRLGIAGAALATGIGQTLTLCIYLVYYKTHSLPVHLRRTCLCPNGRMDLQLYAIGIPAILNLALPSVLISFLNGILSVFSQSYVVVLGIYYKLQTFLYLPGSGIVQGMRPLIAYNYGAGETKRVRKIYRLTLWLCAAIMAMGTVLCLLLSDRLISLFTSNPETIRIGRQALRVISLGFIISAVSVASSGALEGLGKGAASLVISLFRYSFAIMPLAWILCRAMGPTGVWHAFWITEVISAGISVVVYQKSVKLP
ncbi:MATE efflux family protein [Subdoligranulum variabile DSM 15176]|uniref:Probable multidrug resistance protein NorM n=2 Tax=Subdoligranulum variabile TaxID=214851 RepID=D1PKK3_9FIRM|nr:MATE efflux family protein [Subdoligranulum variabile DSM 15176]